MKIHHIGYYVTNIDEARADFQKLGYAISSPCILDETRRVFIQFLESENNMGGGGHSWSWSLPPRDVRFSVD